MSGNVLYTPLIGGYDKLAEVQLVPGWDCVLFTDTPASYAGRGWQVRPLPEACADMKPAKASRYCMTQPAAILPEYDYSIYADANQWASGDLTAFCESLQWPSFGLARHYTRDCVYEELDACVQRCGGGIRTAVESEKARYRAAGMPGRAGMWDTGVILRAHNRPIVKWACTVWWKELCWAEVLRDQPALAYVIWKYKINVTGFDKAARLPYFTEHQHGG